MSSLDSLSSPSPPALAAIELESHAHQGLDTRAISGLTPVLSTPAAPWWVGEKTRRLLIVLMVLLTIALLPIANGLAGEASSRTIYRRIDENGTVCFTDNPDRFDRWEKFINAPSLSGSRFLAYKANFHRWDDVIRTLGKEHNVEPALIKAVVMAESAFNPAAQSRAGARGLMQLLPETARLVGVHDIWDPEQNLEGGTRFLKQMLMRFGSRTLAVAAYNSGPKAVAKFGGVPPFSETRTYVRRVETFYQQFRENDLSFADWQ